MAAPYESFADRLRQALDRSHFVQNRSRTGALADRYEVSRETARKWLTGRAMPELSRIIELCKDFDVSLEWLATGRGQIQIGVNGAGQDRALTETEEKMLSAFRTLSFAKRRALVELLS